MLNLFDEKFQEFSFDSEWERQREYADGCATVENLNEYLKKREDKGFVAAEVVVRSDLDVPLGPARVSGRIDRLEKPRTGPHTSSTLKLVRRFRLKTVFKRIHNSQRTKLRSNQAQLLSSMTASPFEALPRAQAVN